MKKIPLALLAICSLFVAQRSGATEYLITFDDLVPSSGSLTNQYGLTWTDSKWYSNGVAEGYPPTSGTMVGYSNFNSNRIEFGQEVTFLGSSLIGYNYGQYWVGYQDGVVKYTSAARSMDGAFFSLNISLEWEGVDAVSVFSNSDAVFHRGFDHYYVYDDLRYRTGDTGTTVPDDGSTGLMVLGAGLAGCFFRRRR